METSPVEECKHGRNIKKNQPSWKKDERKKKENLEAVFIRTQRLLKPAKWRRPLTVDGLKTEQKGEETKMTPVQRGTDGPFSVRYLYLSSHLSSLFHPSLHDGPRVFENNTMSPRPHQKLRSELLERILLTY